MQSFTRQSIALARFQQNVYLNQKYGAIAPYETEQTQIKRHIDIIKSPASDSIQIQLAKTFLNLFN